MRVIIREIVNFKNRCVWSSKGFVHVCKTEASMRQWIIANLISGYFTFVVPISHTEQAILLAAGILILAAECMNTAIERVVDDISKEFRIAAQQAKDAGSAAVAMTAIAAGIVWLVVLYHVYF